MALFMTGIILGGAVVFCLLEYGRLKSRVIGQGHQDTGPENTQWTNLMNYDGTVRGQYKGED